MAEREPLSGFETVGEAKDARRSTAEGELTSDVDRARFKIDTHLSGVDLPEDLSHEIRERELEARHLSFADFTDITEALHFSLGKPSSGGRWQEWGLMKETIRQRKNEKPGYKRNWSEAGNLFTTLQNAVYPTLSDIHNRDSSQLDTPKDIEIMKEIKDREIAKRDTLAPKPATTTSK
jgi:hypothetical protein